MNTLPLFDLSDNPLKKKCTGPCGRMLPATNEFFSAAKKGKYGLKAICKECQRTEQHEYSSRPEVRAYRQERYKAYSSRPEVKQQTRERKQVYNKEYTKRPDVQEHKQAYNKEYTQRPDVKAYRQTRREAYRSQYEVIQHLRERGKAYRARPDVQERKREYTTNPENRERLRGYVRNRRALKRLARGKHTPGQIQQQYRNQKGRCYYCRKKVGKNYDVDHIVPLSRGGSNDISNLVIACPHCNRRKTDKLPHEWFEGGRLI